MQEFYELKVVVFNLFANLKNSSLTPFLFAKFQFEVAYLRFTNCFAKLLRTIS